MIEATENGREKPAAEPGDGAPPSTSAAEQADRQDKTKDKPDSGQNEDG